MNALVVLPNVSASTPCPAGWCALHPLGDLPEFVKCWPEPSTGCASLLPVQSFGQLEAAPVPTLSASAQILTAVLLVCVGLRRLAR